MILLSLSFHERIESMHCAAAKALRLVFILCDFCCQLFAIRPIEGSHVPWGIAIPDEDGDASYGTANLTLLSGGGNTSIAGGGRGDASFHERAMEMPPRTGITAAGPRKQNRKKNVELDPEQEAYEEMLRRPGAIHPLDRIIKFDTGHFELNDVPELVRIRITEPLKK